jgi:xanthine/uracil permease
MGIIILVISLVISSIFGWQVSKYLVNALTKFLDLFIALLVIYAIGGFIAHQLDCFNSTGLIIGVIAGTLYGIITEAMKIEQQ